MAKFQLQKKDKKLLVTAGIVLAFLVGALVVINILKGNSKEEEVNTGMVMMETPEGVSDVLMDSKTQSYLADDKSSSMGSADDLWESLASDKVAQKEPEEDKKESVVRKMLKEIDDEFEDKEVEEKPRSGHESVTKPYVARVAKEQPEPERPVETVAVKETVFVNVSKKEERDGWGGESISSLGEEEVSIANTLVPVKVMFTKNEKIRNGQRVVVRLLEDMIVDGVKLGANTHLAAICNIGNGRLGVEVTGFTLNGKIYSTRLVGYDTDGSEGIYCPAAEMEDVGSTVKNSGISQVSGILGSALGSTLGNSALGSAVSSLSRSAVQTGAMVMTGSGNKVAVSVPSGYVFYLVKQEI